MGLREQVMNSIKQEYLQKKTRSDGDGQEREHEIREGIGGRVEAMQALSLMSNVMSLIRATLLVCPLRLMLDHRIGLTRVS